MYSSDKFAMPAAAALTHPRHQERHSTRSATMVEAAAGALPARAIRAGEGN